jgi:ATP-binding cassette subfamily B protein
VTVILIAHRVSTIQTADDILVIADGHLSESGTADELLSDPDSYLRRMKDG